jgi:hypothetical protein
VNHLHLCRSFFDVGLCVAMSLPTTLAVESPANQGAGRMVVEPLSRRDFAAKMAKVTIGLPEREVRKLLGKPDDMRTCRELHGTTTGTKEIWCYGTSGHLTFPTLGCVYIDTDGEAQYVFGGQGKPPDSKLVGEEELCNLLRLIDEASTVNASGYNPRTIIRIVNRLQPLGKEKALAAIDEYLRVASSWHSDAREGGLFLVLRVLFDVPADPGYLPRMHIGAPGPWGEPKDPKIIPRFPILLIDDVPLLVVSGYSLGGLPEQVETHVEYFRNKGRLRALPLVPTNRPLTILDHLPAAIEKFFSDSKWASLKDDMLQDQLFRLVYSVYRKKGLGINEDGVSYSGYHREWLSWKEAGTAVDKLEIRWDTKNAKYTFRDGSILPSLPRYSPITWEIKGFDTTATLIIERQDEDVVNIGLKEPLTKGPQVPQPSLRIYRVKNKEVTLIEFSEVGMRGDGAGGRWRGRSGIKLPIGQSVQAEVKLGKETEISPAYEP